VKFRVNVTLCLAFGSITASMAQPAFAADDFRSPTIAYTKSAGFVGGSFRMGFGERGPTPPTARINIGLAQHSGTSQGQFRHLDTGSGLALGLTKAGFPEAYVAGRPVSEFRRELGIAGAGTALLLVGGLAAAGVAVVALSSGNDRRPGPCPPGVEVCIQ
jgi:hypothetical protein